MIQMNYCKYPGLFYKYTIIVKKVISPFKKQYSSKNQSMNISSFFQKVKKTIYDNNFNLMKREKQDKKQLSLDQQSNNQLNKQVSKEINKENKVKRFSKDIKNNEQHESQFLQLDEQIMKKLQNIESSKRTNKENTFRNGKSQGGNDKSFLKKSLSPKNQNQLKANFVHKMKNWEYQLEQLKQRKKEIQQKKAKQSSESILKKQKQQQEQRQFLKLQKQKQIQQKIQAIEQRRQRRQQSLKNAILKRSYNKIPRYSESDQKYKEQQQQQIQINIKLLKNKSQNMKIDPEELKKHEKAYIQRIKQRLNLVPKGEKHEKAKSDFNLYLKRSEQKKNNELNKIVKMKKYQEKLSKMSIKIDQSKKQQKLIEIDKINNPQKYRLLSNKLNDKQIFQQFKNFQVNINKKEIGMNYLKELKQQNDKIIKKRSTSQILKSNPEEKLPRIDLKPKQQIQQAKSKEKFGHKISKSVELTQVDNFKNSIQKNRKKDSQYMKALRQKLAIELQGND